MGGQKSNLGSLKSIVWSLVKSSAVIIKMLPRAWKATMIIKNAVDIKKKCRHDRSWLEKFWGDLLKAHHENEKCTKIKKLALNLEITLTFKNLTIILKKVPPRKSQDPLLTVAPPYIDSLSRIYPLPSNDKKQNQTSTILDIPSKLVIKIKILTLFDPFCSLSQNRL